MSNLASRFGGCRRARFILCFRARRVLEVSLVHPRLARAAYRYAQRSSARFRAASAALHTQAQHLAQAERQRHASKPAQRCRVSCAARACSHTVVARLARTLCPANQGHVTPGLPQQPNANANPARSDFHQHHFDNATASQTIAPFGLSLAGLGRLCRFKSGRPAGRVEAIILRRANSANPFAGRQNPVQCRLVSMTGPRSKTLQFQSIAQPHSQVGAALSASSWSQGLPTAAFLP